MRGKLKKVNGGEKNRQIIEICESNIDKRMNDGEIKINKYFS